MFRSLCLITAITTATSLAACSKAEEAPAVETLEASPTEVTTATVADTAPVSDGLSDEGRAFLATLSPLELGQARLSCIEPLRTATFWGTRILDAELAAALKAAPDMSRTAILSKPPMNNLSIDQARAIMDASPKFEGDRKPTADEITGLKQCLQLAHHFASEQGAK